MGFENAMNDAAAIPKPNRSLLAKSGARLAAVQVLYQAAVNGESAPDADTLMAAYQRYLDDNRENPQEAGVPFVPADLKFLRALLGGVTTFRDTLEPWVERAVAEGKSKERMSPLLLAVLRLAVFELSHFRDRKPGIIINEYVTLTGRFFGEAETGYVNAALNAVAAPLRE
jgi:transcription antitermination factor NusB